MRAGKLSLSVQDPNEQVLNVFDIHVFSGFNPTSRLHDIALLEVINTLPSYIQLGLNLINFNRPLNSLSSTITSSLSFSRCSTIRPLKPLWPAGVPLQYDAIKCYQLVTSQSHLNAIRTPQKKDGGTSSTKLRKTSVTLPADCTADYGSLFFPDYMICAGDFAQDNSSPCRFDEGSPLVQDGAVVGIVSQNKGCNPVDNHLPPTIYTYVFPYTPWLVSYNYVTLITSFLMFITDWKRQDKIAGPQQTLWWS